MKLSWHGHGWFFEGLVVYFCFLFCASSDCLEGYWYRIWLSFTASQEREV